MKILVDTCVWSQVVRRKVPDLELREKLSGLIEESRVVMMGPIRQEILSGISDESQFKNLKNKLSAFEDIPLETEFFVCAADFSNRCRIKGIQGTSIDFLICSVAYNHKFLIWTTDNDFKRYSKYLPIQFF